jgi:hypothetical protein
MESSFESVAWLATACAEILAGLAGPQPGPRPSRPTPSVAPAGAPAPLRSYDGVESLPLLSRARHMTIDSVSRAAEALGARLEMKVVPNRTPVRPPSKPRRKAA